MGGIKISAVSYLNAQPMIFGLLHGAHRAWHDVQLDIPSRCADRVISGEVELGLMPVAMLPRVPNGWIVGTHCIGAEGAVDSVCLLSSTPVEQVEVIHLDPESRTSIGLCRILAREHWGIEPRFVPLSLHHIERELRAGEALLLIGDKALVHSGRFEYVYDLAMAWRSYTGLPFMFAAWISNCKLPEEYIAAFESDLTWGVAHRRESLEYWDGPLPLPFEEALAYLENRIDYAITPEKEEARLRFLAQYESLALPI